MKTFKQKLRSLINEHMKSAPKELRNVVGSEVSAALEKAYFSNDRRYPSRDFDYSLSEYRKISDLFLEAANKCHS